MQLLVNNKMTRLIGYSAIIKESPRVQQPVVLRPGVNEVNAEQFERATKKSLQWAAWIKEGLVEIKQKPADAGEGLGHFSAAEAKKLIEETFDVELLEAWEHEEKRSAVAKAIRDRSKFLASEFAKRPNLENDSAS